jgi:hypothetical protein
MILVILYNINNNKYILIYSYILCNIVIIKTKQDKKNKTRCKMNNNKSIVFKKSMYGQVNLLMIDSLLLKYGVDLRSNTYNVVDMGNSYRIIVKKIEEV